MKQNPVKIKPYSRGGFLKHKMLNCHFKKSTSTENWSNRTEWLCIHKGSGPKGDPGRCILSFYFCPGWLSCRLLLTDRINEALHSPTRRSVAACESTKAPGTQGGRKETFIRVYYSLVPHVNLAPQLRSRVKSHLGSILGTHCTCGQSAWCHMWRVLFRGGL